MLSIIITHISRTMRALSHLYKLPGKQLGNVTKTVSEHKRWQRCSTHFPVQHIQNQAGLSPWHSELHHYLQNNGNNQSYLMVFEVCPHLSLRKWQRTLLDHTEQ